MDIRAKEAGVFVKAFGETGAEVTVGNDFYSLDTSASPSAAPKSSSQPADAAAPPSAEKNSAAPGKRVEVPVPQMGESISQGVLAKWNVEIGSSVNVGDALASVETDKASLTCEAIFTLSRSPSTFNPHFLGKSWHSMLLKGAKFK